MRLYCKSHPIGPLHLDPGCAHTKVVCCRPSPLVGSGDARGPDLASCLLGEGSGPSLWKHQALDEGS
jgi:hypothetical protein